MSCSLEMCLNEARGSDGDSKAWLIPSLTPFSGWSPDFPRHQPFSLREHVHISKAADLSICLPCLRCRSGDGSGVFCILRGG